MIHFDLPKQKSSIIKVLGIGGGGSNAVNFMFSQHVEGVDFVICNTDSKAIEQSKIPNKIQLGPHLTQGLGAGANPEVGKLATEESIQEIKSILEVNTKMAFITAGMGGGTGTGGAPIVAKICKELGILTVGIVTTPFGFEGPRRMQQAEEGIKQLKPYVDTLLVISNDKLRMQYGNLKMKEAFGKADNVLATAAKCITDIINSRGHIIVDFADVCTVMKNGGVAILGKAEAEGENRAMQAIEEALNSPLLNDNEIKGAKWILININTSEGEHECTMDEIEIINNYLRMQAGESSDVIVGMGYDNTLEGKIGITLIATGFDAKDPFAKPAVEVKPQPKEEKIVMTLGVEGDEQKLIDTPNTVNHTQASLFNEPDEMVQPFQPIVVAQVQPNFLNSTSNIDRTTEQPFEVATIASVNEIDSTRYVFNGATLEEQKEQPVVEKVENISIQEPQTDLDININGMRLTEKVENTDSKNSSFLIKPFNIYNEAEQAAANHTPNNHIPFHNIEKESLEEQPLKYEFNSKDEIAEKPFQNDLEPTKSYFSSVKNEEEELDESAINFQLTEKSVTVNDVFAQELTAFDETEQQKRKAAERLHKLRSLSYKPNTGELSEEFENIPAYIRRNMQLFGNTMNIAENFYSKITVNKEDDGAAKLSTINSFLDGKRPD